MASLMEELLDVLGKEEKQYQELITLATEKTDAVVQGNIEHLTDVTTREQDAASVLLNLSNKRNRVLTDMATVLGQSPEEMTITKMIGYLNKQPKEQELDLKAAARSVGEKSVAMIHVADINKVTGYVRGGCSPVGMKKQYTTVFDESVLSQPKVYVSGGRIGTQVCCAPADLIKAARATTAKIIF